MAKELKPSKALEQVEPQEKGDITESDRLKIVVSVGKTGESKSVQNLKA